MNDNEWRIPFEYPTTVRFGRYAEEDPDTRVPPRERKEGPPPGEDFDTLTSRHGKPRGPFDQERGSR